MGMVRIGMGEWGRGESHSPCFSLGKYFCVEFDCAEFDLGEFIWCEFGLVRIVYWGECDSPLREYNSSDCHFVGLFSLILPSLIVWGECECGCDEYDLGECDSPLRGI